MALHCLDSHIDHLIHANKHSSKSDRKAGRTQSLTPRTAALLQRTTQQSGGNMPPGGARCDVTHTHSASRCVATSVMAMDTSPGAAEGCDC